MTLQNAYCFEGSIFAAGSAVQWLRDSIKIIKSAEETNNLYKKSDQAQQIYLVPDNLFYSTTKVNSEDGDIWICTEQEAIANGWVKSKH